jgi:hypothetical protein
MKKYLNELVDFLWDNKDEVLKLKTEIELHKFTPKNISDYFSFDFNEKYFECANLCLNENNNKKDFRNDFLYNISNGAIGQLV